MMSRFEDAIKTYEDAFQMEYDPASPAAHDA